MLRVDEWPVFQKRHLQRQFRKRTLLHVLCRQALYILEHYFKTHCTLNLYYWFNGHSTFCQMFLLWKEEWLTLAVYFKFTLKFRKAFRCTIPKLVLFHRWLLVSGDQIILKMGISISVKLCITLHDSMIIVPPYLETNPGTHFTIDFLIVIQIQWYIGLSVTPLWCIISLQNVAHATTAQLLCHVQNAIVVILLLLRWEQN